MSSLTNPGQYYDEFIEPAADRAREADGRLEVLSLVGSRAYGTDHADSDWDWKGIYVASLPRVLALAKAPGNITVDGSDTTLYELSSFCKLAAAANPTVLEILWADSVAGPLGQKLKGSRRMFLSKKIEKTYGGYAMQQLRKIKENSGGARGANHYKRVKFRLHTLRLLDAGIHALKHGEIQVRHPDPEKLMARAVGFGGSDDKLERYVEQSFEYMRYLTERSDLPEEPNYDAIDMLIYNMRTAQSPGIRPLQSWRTDPQSVGMFT